MIRTRWAATALSAIALTGVVAGCGDDEDEPAASGESTPAETETATATEAPAEPATITIMITGSENNPRYSIDADGQAGLTEMTLLNDSTTELDAQLIRVAGGQSQDEVAAELEKAVNGKPVADWFVASGGPGTAPEGGTTIATQVLEPGTYYVSAEDTIVGSFELTGDAAGELPATEASVEASEYEFAATGLTAGTTPVLLSNAGDEWHHFIAAPINKGATLDDVKRFLETEKGKPPIAFNEIASSTVMDPGVEQVAELELQAGSYAFICFISDKSGGKSHLAEGMISEVEVQ